MNRCLVRAGVAALPATAPPTGAAAPPASAAAPTTKSAALPEGTDIPVDAYERFYHEHFQTWAGEFADTTFAHATTPFYKSTAHLLQLLV